MARSDWPPELLPVGYFAYKRLYEHLTERMMRMRGTITSQSMGSYMHVPLRKAAFRRLSPRGRSTVLMDEERRRREWKRRVQLIRKRLHKRRQRVDPLLQLLRAWADAELTPVEYRQHRIGKTVVNRERITEIPRFRHRLTGATREMVALAEYGHSVAEMVYLASMCDEASLFRLVELDKAFLTSEFAQKWIRVAASHENTEFFGGLANAMRRDTFRDHKATVERAIAIYLLWFLGFELNRPGIAGDSNP